MMDLWLAAANAAADVAGAVIRPFFRTGVSADLKGDASPVTIADRTAERAIRAVLSERFPEHGIMGEEFGLENASARLRWVLDPIDGTRAFITGRPTFGTLIALMDGDTPILGLIDQCVTGERWIGAAGCATTFTGPMGGRPGCRPCPDLADAEASCTSPDMFDDTETPRWNALRNAARRSSFGGDCYSYGLVALGQIDIIVECSMKVWDWAAIVPIIEGAGGRMTDWHGNQLRADGDGRTLVVGDPSLLPTALKFLAD